MSAEKIRQKERRIGKISFQVFFVEPATIVVCSI